MKKSSYEALFINSDNEPPSLGRTMIRARDHPNDFVTSPRLKVQGMSTRLRVGRGRPSLDFLQECAVLPQAILLDDVRQISHVQGERIDGLYAPERVQRGRQVGLVQTANTGGN